jgi:predicted membrane GTPase involved in stress response
MAAASASASASATSPTTTGFKPSVTLAIASSPLIGRSGTMIRLRSATQRTQARVRGGISSPIQSARVPETDDQSCTAKYAADQPAAAGL